MTNRALVTGITGQDGALLSELLLDHDYEVHGLVRRTSSPNTWRLSALNILSNPHLTLHEGDLLEQESLRRAIRKVRPTHVFNLAAQSFVKASFDVPIYTAEADGVGVLRLLEVLREEAPGARVYQASTSEMFGSAPAPQNELTAFRPRSPYASAKLFAHASCVNYREAYGMHVSCGILFNHESELRGEEFVTRKIAIAAARISHGLESEVTLGNLEARRDWGSARDYVRAMLLMVEREQPGDYVIATGEDHSVQEWAEAAFDRVGLDWRAHVKTSSAFERPSEVHRLSGDAAKARRELGWSPDVTFQELVAQMVDAELARLERPSLVISAAGQ